MRTVPGATTGAPHRPPPPPHPLFPPMKPLVAILAALSIASIILALSQGALDSSPSHAAPPMPGAHASD